MLKCKIIGKNLINGTEQEFVIAQGAVFNESYNETLDSGTIIIPQLKAEIEIESFDVVEIFTTSDSNVKINTKRFCVDTYNCIQTCLDPAIFKYEITLFSETKQLEGILLPSLSIKSLKNALNQRTVWYYLRSYLEQYGTKTNSSAEQGAYDDKFSFADEVEIKFDAITCPEMQWNEPTLREVLTDLMMVADCIPVVNNNLISFIDISQTGSEITSSQRAGINYISKSQSSTDYVSEIKTNIVNGIDQDGVTKICENITFRNFDTYLLDTENVLVETTYPIWNLKKCVMKFPIQVYVKVNRVENGNTTFEKYVMMQLYVERNLFGDASVNQPNVLLEYGEWQTKDILYAGFSNISRPTSNYQNTCLYYKRGDNHICNFDGKYEYKRQWNGYWWVDGQKSVLELLKNEYLVQISSSPVRYLFDEQFYEKFREEYPEYTTEEYEYHITAESGMGRKLLYGDEWWKYVCFELEYETQAQHTFFASKGNLPRNKRQIVDNQTQSYVNVKNQGMLEYLKANRLGNKIKHINARYTTDESNIPALAQTVGGSIIFQKEIAVYDNFIKANYKATENYVLRDYYTGIKAKLRSWAILSGDEAFVRNDVLKFYVNSNLSSISNSYQKIPVNTDLSWYINNFKYCAIRFKDKNDNYMPSSANYTFNGLVLGINTFMVEFQKSICGNSAIFTIRMKDNAVVGSKYMSATNSSDGNPLLNYASQKNCTYVDENGENVGGEIYFFNDFTTDFSVKDDNYSFDTRALLLNDTSMYRQILPCVKIGTYPNHQEFGTEVAKIPFKFKKTNQEITQITIQIELNETANDIFLGRK